MRMCKIGSTIERVRSVHLVSPHALAMNYGIKGSCQRHSYHSIKATEVTNSVNIPLLWPCLHIGMALPSMWLCCVIYDQGIKICLYRLRHR